MKERSGAPTAVTKRLAWAGRWARGANEAGDDFVEARREAVYVLGIDPGVANCGWSLLRRKCGEGKWMVLNAGTLTTGANLVLPKRLRLLCIDLRRGLFDPGSKWPWLPVVPAAVAVEEFLPRYRTRAAASVVAAVGAICSWSPVEPVLYSTADVRKQLGLSAIASKQQVWELVRKRVRGWRTLLDEHQRDAACLAYLAGQQLPP